MPPCSGEKVIAFGYRESKIEITTGADGGYHIELHDLGSISIGELDRFLSSAGTRLY